MPLPIYDLSNPEHLAKIPLGYYWVKSWEGSVSPRIIELGILNGKRILTDGCEYTRWTLSEYLYVNKSAELYGPIPKPDFY